MAAEQCPVGKNDVAADHAIVRDVRARHEQIIRANHRRLHQFIRAMHRDVFAENIVIANVHAGWLILVFQVLRRVTDDTAGVKFVSVTNSCHAGQIYMRADHAVRAKLHIRINHGKCADAGVRAELR